LSQVGVELFLEFLEDSSTSCFFSSPYLTLILIDLYSSTSCKTEGSVWSKFDE
jgi:hypothetical protein